MATRIDEIEISSSVNSKINGKHGVSSAEVEEVCGNAPAAKWVEGDDGVRKLYVVGETASGGRLKIVLYPTETGGHFRLATAFAAS